MCAIGHGSLLDGKRRTNRCLKLIDHIIECRRSVVAQALNIKERPNRSDGQHLLKDTNGDETRNLFSAILLFDRSRYQADLHVVIDHRWRNDRLLHTNGQRLHPQRDIFNDLIAVERHVGQLVIARQTQRIKFAHDIGLNKCIGQHGGLNILGLNADRRIGHRNNVVNVVHKGPPFLFYIVF